MTDEIVALWRMHQQTALPDVPPDSKGELWVLDEVIGGCLAYYLDAGRVLDASRAVILEDCRADLERLLPGLDETAATYFSRLGTLASLVLSAHVLGGDACDNGGESLRS